MTIEYHCPVCKAVTRLPDSAEGALASCQRCRLKFVAPAPGQGGSLPPDPFSGAVPGFEDAVPFSKSTASGSGRRRSFMDDIDDEEEETTVRPLFGSGDGEGEDDPQAAPGASPPAAPPPAPNPISMSDLLGSDPFRESPNLVDSTLDHAPINPFAAPPPELGSRDHSQAERHTMRMPRPQPQPQPPSFGAQGENPFATPVPEAPAFVERDEARRETTRRKAEDVAPTRSAAPFTGAGRPSSSRAPAASDSGARPAPKASPTNYELMIVEGFDSFDTFSFKQGGSYVVGRDPTVSICIPTRSVSRRHARIEATGPVPVLIDLGSANGIVVNGTKVSRLVLKDGDLVKLGEVVLRFHTVS